VIVTNSLVIATALMRTLFSIAINLSSLKTRLHFGHKFRDMDVKQIGHLVILPPN
jgi:hypothetical protein